MICFISGTYQASDIASGVILGHQNRTVHVCTQRVGKYISQSWKETNVWSRNYNVFKNTFLKRYRVRMCHIFNSEPCTKQPHTR